MTTHVEGFASAARAFRVLTFMLGIAVTSVILSRSKSGQQLMNIIYHLLDHLFGGAPHTVDMPGPPGLPVVGNLYEVRYNLAFPK